MRRAESSCCLRWRCVRVIVNGWWNGCGRHRSGRGWRSGRGSCCWRRRGAQHADRGAGRGVPADGDRLAGSLFGTGSGRVGRPAAVGAAPAHRPPADRRGHAAAAAAQVRGDALVEPAAGPPLEDRGRHRRPGLAGVRGAALAGGVVPVLHRPAAGGEGRRRRRALSAPAGERGRAVRGREVPDPGAGPDRADPAAAARAGRTPLARLRPARHLHAVRRAGDRHRAGHRRLQAAAPPPGVPRVPAARSPAPTPTASCTW